MTEPKYSIQVYEDHAIIRGWISSDILTLLMKLSKKEGFDYITSNPDGMGFKMVRKNDNF